MPSEKAHLAVAQRNQNLIDHLLADPPRFAEWIATAAFYRALHLVEAVFCNDPDIRHARTHEERERLLKSSRRYSAIYKHYRPIWSASLIARYLEDSTTSVSSFAEYMSPADVKSLLLDHYPRKIESTVEQLLGYSIRPTTTPPPPAPRSIQRVACSSVIRGLAKQCRRIALCWPLDYRGSCQSPIGAFAGKRHRISRTMSQATMECHVRCADSWTNSSL